MTGSSIRAHNPPTARFIRVTSPPFPPLRASANVMQLNQCIQDYEKQGFVRIAALAN